MKEFGSDFHRCEQNFLDKDSVYLDTIDDFRLYSCGRQALEAVIKQGRWQRIWVPAYYCYEVIDHVKKLGVEVLCYWDTPSRIDDDIIVHELPYVEGDVLLRTQYFGLRGKRSNNAIPVPVIEDHTHDLVSEWALNSDADWCIASLRKVLPLAAGGIAWSPKQKELPQTISSTPDCETMASIRYEAMLLKSYYIESIDAGLEIKNSFRAGYVDSEERIGKLKLSGIDKVSASVLNSFDVKKWTQKKLENWHTAVSCIIPDVPILGRRLDCGLNPFSLVLLMDSKESRDKLRHYMIQHSIYPAILWQIPDECAYSEAKLFSDRMLSVHCDARYTQEDMVQMCRIINDYYDKDN